MEASRRAFLKGATALAGAGVVAGLAGGCAPARQQGEGRAGDALQRARDEFEAAAAPIPPADPPETWDETTEVLVVGSGAGGVNAAIRLSQAGYRVLMLERAEEPGGNSKHSSIFSNFGGHRLAEEAGWAYPSYPYDVDRIVEFVLDAQQGTGDPELLRAMAQQGPRCIDWMMDEAGAKWRPMNPSPAGNGLLEWEGMSTPTNGVNVNLVPMRLLTEKAVAEGAELRLNCNVTTLVYDGARVLGVKATHEGVERFIRATRAVVLTAGGMEVNRAMMSRYSATVLAGIANIATPPNGTGECIRMGQGVGADLAGYDSTGAFDGGVWWQDYDQYETMMDCRINKDGNQAIRQPWLRINRLGQRVAFISSSATTYPYNPNAAPSSHGLCETAAIEMAQPGGKTYVIFDSKFDDLVSKNYFGQVICRKAKVVAEDDPFIERVPAWLRDWHTGFDMMVEAGAIKKCATVRELEEALGLRTGVLTNAVQKWNEACAKGEDHMAAFPYKPEWMIALEDPPYYGVAVGGHVFGSKCGLRITPQMQVVNTEGAVIPGLYAGWHTAGGSSGDGNPAGKPLTGMYADLGLSFVGGYMAAGAIMAEDGRGD
ncbi:FAD-dependent oxidoreductase [Eggerthellaceae bacterium zg-1084]|uniref:FAD-dependent oxidoreductase n=1 Tax=Berryella wangjianweii TaxID=2734634 RepID=UPI001557382C|nr:FAD-dependent oxidoreductase [Berryella wangjianweii]NPD30458.1 FAD-dependent oxidoreductase [Berryella wangjianweii]